MKYCFLTFLFFPILAFCQNRVHIGDFEYAGDTLFFNDKIILPGDTLHLGFGSGTNKQFLFIIQQTSNMKKRLLLSPNLPYEFSNAFLIYKRIDKGSVRIHGKTTDFVEPIFGMKKEVETLEWTLFLSNAFKSGEIHL